MQKREKKDGSVKVQEVREREAEVYNNGSEERQGGVLSRSHMSDHGQGGGKRRGEFDTVGKAGRSAREETIARVW